MTVDGESPANRLFHLFLDAGHELYLVGGAVRDRLLGTAVEELTDLDFATSALPAESARIPIFAGVTELPASFEVCAQHRYRTDSAAWVFRRANRLATVRWGETKDIIQKTIADFEERAFQELPFVEKIASDLCGKGDNPEGIKKARAYLTKYTNDFARAAMSTYWELGDRFWTMFSRGF